jgi:hypothetical protein
VTVIGAASTGFDKFEKSRAFHIPFLFTARVTAREDSFPVERKYTCKAKESFAY